MTETRKKITRREFIRLIGISLTSISAGRIKHAVGHPSAPEQSKKTKPDGRTRRPYWVRTVEHPTIEINWDEVRRFDARDAVRGVGMIKHLGEEKVKYLNEVAQYNEKQRLEDKVAGYTLKEQALRNAQVHSFIERSFLGPRRAITPEDRGVPRWSGSPTKAARILRVAMRHFGAANIGVIELNDNTRKLIYSHDPDGKQIVFEDAENAYETDEKRVVPNKAKWVIVFTVQLSKEAFKRAPSLIAAQTASLSYNRAAYIQNATQEFLRGLGYQCLGEAQTNALGISPAFGVMAGLGEMSRLNRMITPEHGPLVRVFKLITDLPLAVDKPIDAGIMEFCKSCKKCAESCPPAALSFDDEPSWDIKGGWNNRGHKTYYEDSTKCMTYWREKAGSSCGICFAVCPFSKGDKVWLHDWVKASISTMPVLNGLFRSLDDAFSYGAKKDDEEWWQLDLPEYGINYKESD